MNFVFGSCDLVDHSFTRNSNNDPRSHTKQHEFKHSSLEVNTSLLQLTVLQSRRRYGGCRVPDNT